MSRKAFAGSHRQRGAVIVLVAVGIGALILCAALTLDVGPLPVLASRIKLLQVLGNLLRNAIDFVRDAPTREIRLSTPSPRLIRIVDTGPGVPPEAASRLFTLGFSTRPGGHGIGLHSAAILAREMGGSLRFAGNAPGAAFELELAAAD